MITTRVMAEGLLECLRLMTDISRSYLVVPYRQNDFLF